MVLRVAIVEVGGTGLAVRFIPLRTTLSRTGCRHALDFPVWLPEDGGYLQRGFFPGRPLNPTQGGDSERRTPRHPDRRLQRSRLSEARLRRSEEGPRDGLIFIEGAILVSREADGTIDVKETGDHDVFKGATLGIAGGFVLGLFAPPLLGAMVVGGAIGGVIGKLTKHHDESKIKKDIEDVLPPGTSGSSLSSTRSG